MQSSRLHRAHVNLLELGSGKGHVLCSFQSLFLFDSPAVQHSCMSSLVNKYIYEEVKSEGLGAEGLKDQFPEESL